MTEANERGATLTPEESQALIKELRDENAKHRIKARESEQEAERLRVELTVKTAGFETRQAQEEAARLRAELAAKNQPPTDEELITAGTKSQAFFDQNKDKVLEALQRQNRAAERARRDADAEQR